jgi:hypothetical protein
VCEFVTSGRLKAAPTNSLEGPTNSLRALEPRFFSLGSAQFLHSDVSELDEGRGRSPRAVLDRAVVLEADRAALREAREHRVLDDRVAVEEDAHAVAAKGDFHFVPFADVLVAVHARRRGGTNRLRLRGVAADAPQLARTSWPAPQVHLMLRPPAQKDARVRVGEAHRHGLAVGPKLFGPVRQQDAAVLVGVRRILESPFEPEHEVAIGFLRPQMLLASGLALRVVVDDAVDHLPMAAVALGHLESGQVAPVEDQYEAVRRSRSRLHPDECRCRECHHQYGKPTTNTHVLCPPLEPRIHSGGSRGGRLQSRSSLELSL